MVVITHTPFVSSDLPPTPNPTPTELMRVTLPAEWTREPTPEATPTSAVTAAPTIDLTGTFVFGQPTRPACESFGVNTVLADTTYIPGQPIRLAWIEVPNASAYRVSFVDASRNVLYERDIAGTTMDIPGEIVGRDAIYLWTVRPLDFGSNQMCNSVGALLSIDL